MDFPRGELNLTLALLTPLIKSDDSEFKLCGDDYIYCE
jgi:hypothetical protein